MCSLAPHTRCSNLKCFRAPAEGAGAFPKCGGCRIVRYCSRACQKADWRAHSALCATMGLEKSDAILAQVKRVTRWVDGNPFLTALAVRALLDAGVDAADTHFVDIEVCTDDPKKLRIVRVDVVDRTEANPAMRAYFEDCGDVIRRSRIVLVSMSGGGALRMPALHKLPDGTVVPVDWAELKAMDNPRLSVKTLLKAAINDEARPRLMRRV